MIMSTIARPICRYCKIFVICLKFFIWNLGIGAIHLKYNNYAQKVLTMRYCRIANIIIIRNISGNFYCIDSSNIKLGYLQMTTIAKRYIILMRSSGMPVKALLKSKRPVIEIP